MGWIGGWPPQDDVEEDAEKERSRIERGEKKPRIPWWVHNWYWPGVWMGIVALAALGYSPWSGDSPGRVVAAALALIGIAVVITFVYMLKADNYGAKEKAVAEAEREVYAKWSSEAAYEHCKDHCQCSFCVTRRQQQKLKAIG